jgi:hypothetical protein
MGLGLRFAPVVCRCWLQLLLLRTIQPPEASYVRQTETNEPDSVRSGPVAWQ